MRAFVATGYAFLIGSVLGLANIYLGLKLGFVVGVALLTVFALGGSAQFWMRVSGSPQVFSKVDYACFQSLASAMSYGAGTVLATAFSALVLADAMPDKPWLIAFWMSGICVLGCLVAFPFRSLMLRAHPFPSGKIAAQSAKVLLEGKSMALFFGWFTASGIWTLVKNLTDKIPEMLLGFRGWGAGSSTMLWGLGAILGLRTCLSMLLGAVFAFELLPLVWEGHSDRTGQWLAVSMMVSASLADLLRQALQRDPRSKGALAAVMAMWKQLLPMTLLLAAVSIWLFGELAVILIAMVALPFFSLVSMRVTGETDVVPTGALGKLALLLFGVLPGAGAMVGTAVLAGSSAAASDFMTDLRCGEELGCPPRRQLRYQLLGAFVGPLIFVPVVWFVLMPHFPIGGDRFPAPAAQIWLEVWQLTGSTGINLDPGLLAAVGWGATIGLVGSALAAIPRIKRWLPAVVPFAFATFLDPLTTSTMLCGAIAMRFMGDNAWEKAVALVAGESVWIWAAFPFMI